MARSKQKTYATLDYSTTTVPADYKCAECQATNCKLWREYQTFSPQLLCARCAAKDQGKSIDSIDDQGRRLSELPVQERTDQIGWYVPAIPTVDLSGYWGYASIPDEGEDWWRRLPTLPN